MDTNVPVPALDPFAPLTVITIVWVPAPKPVNETNPPNNGVAR